MDWATSQRKVEWATLQGQNLQALKVNFLVAAVQEHKAPKVSLISLLKANLGGWQPARPHKTIHASSLTRVGFCPREVALLDITEKLPKREYIPTALAATFDMGNAVADLVREQWLGDAAFGNWRCRQCGKTAIRCTRPELCHGNGPSTWQYEEVRFHSDELDAAGGIDVLTRMGNLNLQVVELKIMAPDQFEKLAAPLAEHRIRTCLYLKMIADSKDPLKKRINLQEGRVLYVSRGFGKKNAEFNEILPFKEYVVARNDACLTEVTEKAEAVKKFRTIGLMPYGVCKSNVDPRTKSCGVVKECMSGVFPPGKMCGATVGEPG